MIILHFIAECILDYIYETSFIYVLLHIQILFRNKKIIIYK